MIIMLNVIVCSLCGVSFALGSTMLANYDFANNDGVSAVTGGGYNVIANDLTISTAQFDYASPFSSNRLVVSASDTNSTSLSSGPDYFEFSLDFSGGDLVKLYSLNLQVNGLALTGSGTNIALFTSTDGFVSSQLVGNYDEVLQNNVDQNVVFGLGGLDENTFEAGDEITFRIELKDIHGSTTRWYRFDNIQVFGVPEPGSCLLLGLGSLWIFSGRSRSCMTRR